MLKTYTLRSYQRKPNGHDLLICSRDFPDLKVGDVIEIYHPDDDAKRVLLKVNDLGGSADHPKDSVAIDEDIIKKFSFKAFTNVHVRKVPHSEVVVDLVVLTCKDIYLGRSDMWQLKVNVAGNCVYLTKKIAFCDQNQQIAVSEIWARGEKWNCGLVTESTKICFRSTTACMNIFIQMSSEMWEYDSFGDLYFEKAVGFLRELFNKWKKEDCLHDVTIVLFSRTFYNARSLEEIPSDMREGIQVDYMGRLYEDFYRILIQNERYDEWTTSLVKLKKVFIEYRHTVLRFHGSDSQLSADLGCGKTMKASAGSQTLPSAFNSSAAQGNFLEVMNMSLNVYERYYIDRNFDRLGKVCMIITPGPGVFEVDRTLMLITKQRTIDSGCAADLICMGEQPLHAVPLFKYHKLPKEHRPDDYCIPHWINHSFYTSQSQIRVTATSQFIPRVKIASKKQNLVTPSINVPTATLRPEASMPVSPADDSHVWSPQRTDASDLSPVPESEYDAYDAGVFKTAKPGRLRSATSIAVLGGGGSKKLLGLPQTAAEALQFKAPRRRGVSDNYSLTIVEREAFAAGAARAARASAGASNLNKSFCFVQPDANGAPERSSEITICKNSVDSNESEDQFNDHLPVGSPDVSDGRFRSMPLTHANKALINPFAPSYIRFRMTSNRRRWAHAFPLDKHGQTIQPHHQHNEVSAALSMSSKLMLTSGSYKVQTFRRVSTEPHLKRQDSMNSVVMAGEVAGMVSTSHRNRTISNDSLEDSVYVSPHSSTVVGSQGEGSSSVTAHDGCLWDAGWGVAGDREWSPMITTGVDWRSLTRPALLPVTTDYLPDKQSFVKDYIVASNYNLEADSSNETGVADASTLAASYFKELVNTRIALGFQLILLPQKQDQDLSDKSMEKIPAALPYSHLAYLSRARPRVQKETYNLSIGRIFHELTKCDNVITVTVQRPKEPMKQDPVQYKYRFMCPDESRYIVSWTRYATEQLDEYNWNYLDNYIITRGDGQEHNLIESLKYWRARFLLLPTNNPGLAQQLNATKMKQVPHLDIAAERSLGELSKAGDEFLKLMEFINKFKRSVTTSASTGVKGKIEKTGSTDNAVAASDLAAAVEYGSHKTKAIHDSVPSGVLLPQMMGETFDVSSVDCTKLADNLVHSDSLQFVKHDRLPMNTFVAAEACAWVLKNVPSVKSQLHAVQLMQHLAKQGFIRHVSGNPKVKFEYGMHLFYVSSPALSGGAVESSTAFGSMGLAAKDDEAKKTWIEVTVAREDELGEAALVGSAPQEAPVAVANLLPWGGSTQNLATPGTPVSSAPSSLKRDSMMTSARKPFLNSSTYVQTHAKHRNATVEIDSGEKSGRVEWATVRHDSYYHPRCIFDMEIDWIVATGMLISEMIKAWTKKASSLGFQLLPAAVDPFALPHNENSDPLRGPIFIPLNMACLRARHALGTQGREATLDSVHVKHLKQAIVKRYGFLPVSWDPERGCGCSSNGRGFYVHSSGGMYLNQEACCIGHGRSTPSSELPVASTASASDKDEAAVGFTWSWNFMLSKRWRSNSTGDEAFQDAMLADFRAFCSGCDGRLTAVWHAVLGESGAVAAASTASA